MTDTNAFSATHPDFPMTGVAYLMAQSMVTCHCQYGDADQAYKDYMSDVATATITTKATDHPTVDPKAGHVWAWDYTDLVWRQIPSLTHWMP